MLVAAGRPEIYSTFPRELAGIGIFCLLVKIDNLWSWSISSWLGRGWTKNFDTPVVAIFGRMTVSPDDGGFGARSWLGSPWEPRSTPFEPVPEDAG